MNQADSEGREQERRAGRRRAVALGAVAGAAAAGFAALAAAVARRDTARVDHQVRKATAADPDGDTAQAADSLKYVGKWYTYVPAAAAASAAVLLARGGDGDGRNGRSRRVGAGALMLTGTVCTALNPAFDHLLPQPPAPPGHSSPNKPVFPSGHAFGPGAVSLAAAYVLSREGIAPAAIAFPAALAVPVVTAGGRMLVQKHWASDVAGGLLGGIAVAALCLSAYEATRG